MPDCTDRPPPVMRGLQILAGLVLIAAAGVVAVVWLGLT